MAARVVMMDVGGAPNQPETGSPVAEVLSSVANELQALASLSDRLQTLISTALVADSAINARHLQEFQAIDLLVQRLSGVATFVQALSDASPQTWRLDTTAAAALVTLSDLSRRLSGQSENYPSRRSSDDDGDFEIFA